MAGYGEVTGLVTIEAAGAPRQLIAISFLPFDLAGSDDGQGNPVQVRQVVGTAMSAADGTYTMQLPGFSDEVIVIAMDEYGVPFGPNRSYSVGDKIRPTAGNETGYVYRCTIAGVSGATEPAWWDNTGGQTLGAVGTATFEAIEVWWPVAHAPIMPIWHEGGTGSIYPIELDTFFPYLVSLIHAETGDGSALGEFDLFENEWDFEGSVAITGDEARWGLGSLAFDGSGDYIIRRGTLWTGARPAPVDASPFTIEGWIRTTSLNGTATIFGQYEVSDPDRFLFQLKDAQLYAFHGSGSSGQGATTLLLNSWNHVALVFDEAKQLRVYLNGTIELALDWSAVTAFADHWSTIGARYSAGSLQDYFSGNMDDIRITHAARYAGNTIDVPTEAFPDTRFLPGNEPTILDEYFRERASLIHAEGLDGAIVVQDEIGVAWAAQNNAEISTGSFKFGASSMFFPDPGDWFYTTSSQSPGDPLHLGGEYTMEAWVFIPDLVTTRGFFHQSAVASSDDDIFQVRLNSLDPTKIFVLCRLGGVDLLNFSTLSCINSVGWHHIAITKGALVVSVYCDGVRVGFDSLSAEWDLANAFLRLGSGRLAGTGYVNLDSFMDEFRFTNAVRYTADFTPPATAFTDIEYDPNEVVNP